MNDAPAKCILVTIQGSSMEPLYPSFTRLIILPDSCDLEIGDILVFHYFQSVVVHRLVNIINGKIIITKGDNNLHFDKPIHRNKIIGRIVDKYNNNKYKISKYSSMVGQIKIKFGSDKPITLFIHHIFQKYLEEGLNRYG